MGASVLLCHLVTADDNRDILHIANVGLNEAILCSNGEVIQITLPHVADKSKNELERVVGLKGFVTKVSRCFATVCVNAMSCVFVGWNDQCCL